MIDKLILWAVKQVFTTAVILYLIFHFMPVFPSLEFGCQYSLRRTGTVTVEPLGGL